MKGGDAMSCSSDTKWMIGVLLASFALLSALAKAEPIDAAGASAEAPRSSEDGARHERAEGELEPLDDAAEKPERASRWLVPEAAPNRLSMDVAAGFIPESSTWLFLNTELDHPSGFIARSTYSLDLRASSRPRDNFGSLSIGYRWRGRYELGATGMVASGPGLQRVWSGGAGVFIGFGTPEGVRLTLTVLGSVIGRLDPSGSQGSAVLPYDLQIPILAIERLRLFVVNRGFAAFSSPRLFVHRAELHALIANRWRVYAGALFCEGDAQIGYGGVFGLGARFADR